MALATLIGIASALAKTKRGEADVTGEVRGAGLAFGDLVRATGDAVANTQRQLNDTSATSATALATTKVDVIAVQEKIFDDLGNLDSVQTFTRKLPLVNFIDPVFYEWTSVRLQGEFFAREFTSESNSKSSSFNSSSNSAGPTGGGLMSFVLGPPRFTTSGSSSQSSSSNATSSSDTAIGTMRMTALLRPRRDVGVPKPNQAIQGPRLAIIEGEILDIAGPPAARTASVLLEYRRRDGSPIVGKALSIDTHGIPWQFADPANTVTDAQGRVEIEMRREFLDPEADRSPIDVIVEARIGLVSNSVTVTF
jgi:hypothetical protein